jgi:hypothetical protein
MQAHQIWRNRFDYALAGLLLLLLAAELGLFARRQSQTIDEADHSLGSSLLLGKW